jgi:hypothetical protein
MDDPVVFCADVGSVRSGRFGWACGSPPVDDAHQVNPSSPQHLADAVADRLCAGRRVALGFECPMFVPVPEQEERLGAARPGEGNRPWSAGAGSGALATGLVQAAWVLATIRRRCPNATLYLDWDRFARARSGLLIWEAFVTATAKGSSHVDDAKIAVDAFVRSVREHPARPGSCAAVTAERPLSLAGAVAIWSGWLNDPLALHAPTLVIRAG